MAFPEHRSGKRLLRRAQVLSKLGVGATTLFKGIEKGIYPPPVQLALDPDAKRMTSLWLEHEIDEAIERLAAARDAGRLKPLARERTAKGNFPKSPSADTPAE
jgi:predicted DNA-binding transcriptional regulator AlpA